ncbi:MAG: hypothetical protein U1D30_04510 [Planctomycetota bacterium]
MATKKKRPGRQPKDGGPNRSEFIRSVLTSNPKASSKDVQAAWEAAGYKDKLNPTLYYIAKKKLGLMKGGRGRGRGRGRKAVNVVANGAAVPVKPESESYLEIERTLDKLIAKAEDLQDRKLAEDLRQARRRASLALV